MKLTTLTLDYQITRSREFQSARLGASVTVELKEGESKAEAIRCATAWLADQLNPLADEALECAIQERRMVDGI